MKWRFATGIFRIDSGLVREKKLETYACCDAFLDSIESTVVISTCPCSEAQCRGVV